MVEYWLFGPPEGGPVSITRHETVAPNRHGRIKTQKSSIKKRVFFGI
jgi:hypothetical protein